MSSATELMDMEISKLSETEFRRAIIKLLARLEKSTNNNTDSLRAEMKSKQAKVKNPMNEMQSKLDALMERVSEAEERISDLEDRPMERKETEEKRVKQLIAHEERLREFNDTLKRTNIKIIGIQEGVEREG